MGDLVLVTGGTGYVANYTIKELLERGYKVRTTVRSLTSPKVEILKEGCGVDGMAGAVELFVADLSSEDGWTEACEGCKYVIHTASPVGDFKDPSKDQMLIDSAVDGTLRALRGVVAAGNTCERVVLTSSVTAILPSRNRLADANYPLNEETWTNIEAAGGYARSKVLAESKAWEFAKENNIELVTILPSFVIGPCLTKANRSVSLSQLDPFFRYAKCRVKALPIRQPAVDVRDVASIHVEAMVNPDAKGQRIIAHRASRSPREYFAILKELGYSHMPKEYNPPLVKTALKLGGLVSPKIKGYAALWKNRDLEMLDNSKSKSLLNFEYRTIEETVKDYAQSCEDLGLIAESVSLKK